MNLDAASTVIGIVAVAVGFASGLLARGRNEGQTSAQLTVISTTLGKLEARFDSLDGSGRRQGERIGVLERDVEHLADRLDRLERQQGGEITGPHRVT